MLRFKAVREAICFEHCRLAHEDCPMDADKQAKIAAHEECARSDAL